MISKGITMKAIRLLTAGVLLMSVSTAGVASAQSTVPGYTAGAQMMRVEVTGGQIDTIGGVIYSR